MAADWVPDVLGEPFEQLTLDLGVEGDNGPLVATLVRLRPNPIAALVQPLRDVDVLYVHGWSDFFFQTQLARFWTGLGARFHALDLRRYGRSLRADNVPGYIDALDDYDVDIEAALVAMGHATDAASRRRLVLLGHSTGGLTLTLWAARNPGRASALVLNSPWLEFQFGAVGRQAIAPLVSARARFDPRGTQPVVDLGFYTRAQTEVGALPLPVDEPSWRPERGFPTRPGWLAAILEGHRRVAAGVEVGCPVLVLLSARSTPPISWNETMTSTDSVLVVDDIAKSATRIGRLVTIARIDGAIHDVFLSRPEPRAQAYRDLERWLRAR
ncbi:alpha/beta hydrolase [Microbacterium sulfonylureivorans]|uniref:alpha/beta hydrolase n=1 Tax=Microbacterium sulfonylureivorans TaxID=2486854 RepID=UPI000FD71162|nr:alpha/beta hydrolase [Microbacterium sulfonylureivorans]